MEQKINISELQDKTFLVGCYRPEKNQLSWILDEKHEHNGMLYNVRVNADLFSYRRGAIANESKPDYVLVYNYQDPAAPLHVFSCYSSSIKSQVDMDNLHYPDPQGTYVVYRLDAQYEVEDIDLQRLLLYARQKYPRLDENAPFFVTGAEVLGNKPADVQIAPVLLQPRFVPQPMARQPKTYISLFSSAGIGCYGFKEESFECIATAELLERRLNVQRANHKCRYDTGYICGDMTLQHTKDLIHAELAMWQERHHINNLDVLIATPPCQGMSVANHKKKQNEIQRNSLVLESITMTRDLQPKIFIFENVRAFLTSACTDGDDNVCSIREAIDNNLSGLYNILFKVVNFKDYGNPSSRTRTLVIGVRKDLREITPHMLFPDRQPERTLRQVIGQLPPLHVMGDMWDEDIFHNFKAYSPHMLPWIENLREGESAFDNEDPMRRPHTIKDGQIVFNAEKNGDKYTRQYWDKVAPCIHTRNDIMASQSTVHPVDNRVFSIREVMLMMSVPETFRWTDHSLEELNQMPLLQKAAYLKANETNIRQNLGEAVPTVIFRQIAHKIKGCFDNATNFEQDIPNIIRNFELSNEDNLIEYIRDNQHLGFTKLSKIAELANAEREEDAAYYTSQDLCFSNLNRLPDFEEAGVLHILEPSVGVGNFIPSIIEKYRDIPDVYLDICDISARSIRVLQELIPLLNVPDNFHINYIIDDFLLHHFECQYDVVVGNPPFKKLTHNPSLLASYKRMAYNTETNNLFSFFIEKAMHVGRYVSLIVPKSLINAPEFNRTRELMGRNAILDIFDYGEKGFKGVKIETISFVVRVGAQPSKTRIESYITKDINIHDQSYITDGTYPYWLIYRNESFDRVANKLEFGIFTSYRDRSITKKDTRDTGAYRVLKSRNIGSNSIVDIDGYDCYIDDISSLDVSKFLNDESCYLLPNLTYNPRACRMPRGCIADGSVAILKTINPATVITDDDLAYYATEEFHQFYMIARNRGTRSLNIDNNSVFFFGKLKSNAI